MSKNGKWAYFGATIEIFGHDQNIRTPEKFYFCDVEQFRSLFQKWIHQANKRPYRVFKKIKTGYFGKQKWRYMDMIKIMDV